MKGRRRAGLLPRALMVLLASSGLAFQPLAEEQPVAKEPTAAAANEQLLATVQSRLKGVEDDKELEPALKARLIDVYTKTVDQLRSAAESLARNEQFQSLRRKAPETSETVKAELSHPASEQAPAVPAEATLPQVQEALSEAETRLNEVQDALQSLQGEPKRRADRRLEIPKRIDAARLQLADIQKQLETKPPPDEPAELTLANRQWLEARKRSINAEIAACQSELQYYESTGELLSVQRDLAVRRVAEAEAQAKALRTLVNERRRQEAERQALAARKTSAQAHPSVRQIAEANGELARRRKALSERIEEASRELEQIDQQVSALDERYKKVTQRYETAGATEAIGLLLRKQRGELLDVGMMERRIKALSHEISTVYLELIDDEEHRNELASLSRRVQEVLKGFDPAATGPGREFFEEEVRNVLEAQRDLYDSLIADSNSYLDLLVELDVRERQLIARTQAYAAFCDERILWIRSTTMIAPSLGQQTASALMWLASPGAWLEVAKAWQADVAEHPALTAFIAALLILLILVQRPVRQSLAKLGEQAERSNQTSYWPTLHAILLTGLLAALWPGLLVYLGVRMAASDSSSEFVDALGKGLTATAIVFGTLEFFRQVCRRRGLAECHFAWDPDAVRLIRSTVLWFMMGGLPFLLVVTVTEAQSSEAVKNSLGRLAFFGAMSMLLICSHRLLRPAGGALEKIVASTPDGWSGRWQRFWHLAAVAAPISLGILACGGYYFTALELAWRVLETFWLLIGLWIVYSALLRWSLLSYRDLAMRKARERRAQADAADAASDPAASSPAAAVVKAQPEVKLSDINKQTRKALQLALFVGLVAGLWLIWIDVLPALGALRHVELWAVEVPGGSDAGAATVRQPITLDNVLLAVLLAALTFAAARNVPSLLEITLLQRLPLDPGVRYAITTVSQYAITALGLVSAFAVIGIGWSKVQWLVAAISVGLGFGLQEIFANFVSGLILLFERPVRVGDIVTVGDVTGHVSRIQMRATTIIDWDMRELVVPNKEFITGRVMNWTLSNSVSRMSIVVGVAYGTNPDAVRELLLEIARRHPLVLKEPPPHALFDDFAESTLNFVLRVYMPSRSIFLQLRHELLTEIAHQFHQAGIQIAFPQRDIHIRTAPASLPEPIAHSEKRRANPQPMVPT
jgi:potassium efflux system protein